MHLDRAATSRKGTDRLTGDKGYETRTLCRHLKDMSRSKNHEWIASTASPSVGRPMCGGEARSEQAPCEGG